jgi:glycosyltransferase involved in cell wall biosynthesis
LIRPGQDGLLVRCGDVDALAQTMHALIADQGLRWRLGSCGAERARREFRWEDKLRCVRGAYEMLTGGRDQVPGLPSPGRQNSTSRRCP